MSEHNILSAHLEHNPMSSFFFSSLLFMCLLYYLPTCPKDRCVCVFTELNAWQKVDKIDIRVITNVQSFFILLNSFFFFLFFYHETLGHVDIPCECVSIINLLCELASKYCPNFMFPFLLITE